MLGKINFTLCSDNRIEVCIPATGADYNPDSWYYCIKMEMEHTIYHRFTETDYRLMIEQGL